MRPRPADRRSWIAFTIGLCFQLMASFALLSFVHGSLTQTLPVRGQTHGGVTSFEIDVEGASWFSPGNELPIYRYQSEVSFELGRAVVTNVEGRTLTLATIESSLLAPLGRHGKIVDVDSDRVRLSYDAERPYSIADRLIVFRGTTRVGAVEVQSLGTDSFGRGLASARVVEAQERVQSWADHSVSEYTIMTTVSVFPPNPWIYAVEIVLLVALVALEAFVFVRRGYGLLALALRPLVDAYRSRSDRTKALWKWIVVGILALPVSIFLGQFFVLVVNRLTSSLPIAVPAIDFELWPYLTGLLLGSGVAIAIVQRTRSFEFVRSAFRFRGRLKTLVRHPLAFRFLVWALNFAVVAVFATTLFGFVSGNLNVAFQYLLPSGVELRSSYLSIFDPYSFVLWGSQTAFNVGQIVQYGFRDLSFDQAMVAVRYVLWSLTIVGCMVGYVHSVVKPFFWTSIRNVDFTVTGWLVNGVCYGPLFATALWTLVPSGYFGLYPTVASGPLFYAIVTMDFLTNVLYMFSVWNMGTKFGVMVDKGVVRHGFYAATRHPSYALESLMFFFAALRGFNTPFHWLGISVIFITYWLRSEREDHFMAASNPDYVEYRKTVPWKYVPGLV